jgi:prepilin-type N-terminal cleavage/methylation domain-containing protein
MTKGFTLVEVLVVMVITVFLAGGLLTSFSRVRVDLGQTRTFVQNAIREAQSLALAGAVHAGSYRCGYGIHFEPDAYTIYAGPSADDVDCTTQDPRFDPDGEDDVVVRTGYVANDQITIGQAPDIFFAPPKPTTYIGSLGAGEATIVISRVGVACGDLQTSTVDCKFIDVTTSGVITIR